MTAITAIADPLPRWALMWLLAGGLFLAGKAAMRTALRPGMPRPTLFHELAWVGLWPGMDAAAFFSQPLSRPTTAHPRPWQGLLSAAAGAALLWGVARHLPQPLVAGWAGMMGLILILHFGAFSILAGLWRWRGIPVCPIMARPAAATSLSEFWGRRWNRAFRDLAHHLIFRPALRRWGRHTAMSLVFLASGLVHELVITVPAGAGCGLPTTYFLIQAAGMSLERRFFRQTSASPSSRQVIICRWFFTHAFTVGPVFLLFPPAFVERVMVPYFQFIHALP